MEEDATMGNGIADIIRSNNSLQSEEEETPDVTLAVKSHQFFANNIITMPSKASLEMNRESLTKRGI